MDQLELECLFTRVIRRGPFTVIIISQLLSSTTGKKIYIALGKTEGVQIASIKLYNKLTDLCQEM